MSEGVSRSEQSTRTREALLGAGLEILKEEPAAVVFDRLDARAVTQRIGVTTGAFYHHFDGGDGYVEALLQHSLLVDRNRPFAVAVPRFEELVTSGASFVEAFIAGASRMAEYQDTNLTFTLQVAVWARRARSTDITKRLRRMYAQVEDETSRYYADMLALVGREPRRPYQLTDLAGAFIAIFEGTSLRRGVDPSAVPSDRLGELLVPILALMTRGSDDDLDASEWLAQHGPRWLRAGENS